MADSSRIFFFVCLTILVASYKSFGQNAVSDPVVTIEEGDLKVRLKEWVTVPKSSNSKPFARINMMRELPDGSGRMAVNDLNGPFYFIPDSVEINEYLNIKDLFPDFQFTNGKGSGFGGFAFHPEFETNGKFFTSHSEVPRGREADFKANEHDGIDIQWVLTRWTATDPSLNEFSGSREEMARWDFPTVIHGVQDMSFNPHALPGDDDYGLLYICIGEGGSGLHAFHDNVQTPSSHLGTIWRIDPLGTGGSTGKYGIPGDNPAYNEETPLKEIWAYGFRNPHRMHFEQRGEEVLLFTGDIGELNIEEVNIVQKGGNYGWDKREGTFVFNIEQSRETLYELPENDDPEYLYPVAQYDHDDGLAINLGHVWHSERVPEFEGVFFMGDIPTGRIFYTAVDSLQMGRQSPLLAARTYNSLNEEMPLSQIVENARVDIKFGYDSSGEVYFLTKANGTIYKVDIPGETVIDTTSAEPLTTEHVKVPSMIFPTEVQEELNISLETTNALVIIMDIHGRVFLSRKLHAGSSTIDVSGLRPGVYIARIKSDNQWIQNRFIKTNK